MLSFLCILSLVQGHALASQRANLYMDSAILALQYVIQNGKLEPSHLSEEYNFHYKDEQGVGAIVTFSNGSLSGLSKVKRYLKCDGPETIYDSTFIDCTLVFDSLETSHKGKVKYGVQPEVSFHAKGNVHSVYVKVAIVKAFSDRYPQVKKCSIIKYEPINADLTGLGPFKDQVEILRDDYRSVVTDALNYNINNTFMKALNLTVASLPVPVD